MSETTNPTNALTVQQGDTWLQTLTTLSADTLAHLKALSGSVVTLQASTGKLAVEMGRTLKQVKAVLTEEAPEMWDSWVDHFGYSKDYVNRMIQTADFVEKHPQLVGNLDDLSLRHLREIDRFSRGGADISVLTQSILNSGLTIDQTRFLVSASKNGKVDLDKLVKENPDLKPAVDQLRKQAKTEAETENRTKTAELKEKMRDLQVSSDQLRADVSEKEEQMNSVVNSFHTQQAAEEIGEGDSEKGLLLIEVEQLKQQLANKEDALTQLSGDFSRVQSNYEQWRNSPVGMVKLDYRKHMDDIIKFFSQTMTSASLMANLQSLDSDEAREETSKMLEVVRGWLDEMERNLALETV